MDKERSGKFMQKVVGDVATALASALVLTGDKAGLFRAMAGAGAMQATELASRAGNTNHTQARRIGVAPKWPMSA